MRGKILWVVLALAVVLGITTAASATTRTLITGKQIAPHAINSKHLVNHTVQAHDLSARLIKSLHGAKGATGPAGPQGDPGIFGHAIANAAYHINPGMEATVSVTAPADKVVLGGGVSSATPGALVVEQSYPSSATTWTVTVYNWPDAPATDFTVYAVVGTVS